MNYYISDMHLFHKNVTKEGNNFDNRPFNSLAEMHEYMKEKWNSKISNGDSVYILGDIAMRGTNEELIGMFLKRYMIIRKLLTMQTKMHTSLY